MPSKVHAAHGFFAPWKTDAQMFFGASDGGLDARGDREKLRNLQLVVPTKLKDFERDGTLIVAGDRGTGKSLILARKAAQRLHQATADRRYLTLVDGPPFVSLLPPNSINVSSRDYRRYSSPQVWKLIWLVVLKTHFACMAIRMRNDPQTRDVSYVLKHYFTLPDTPPDASFRDFVSQIWDSFHIQETIGTAIQYLVQRSASKQEMEKWSTLAGTAIARASDASWQHAIFVDGIDEALGDTAGNSLLNDVRLGAREGTHAQDSTGAIDQPPQERLAELRSLVLAVMLHAQTGFVQAADEIRAKFRSLKCYGAVRHEAAAWVLDPSKTGKLSAKMEGPVLALIDYQRDQLKAIFALNVDHSDAELADRDASNASKRLYGFRAIRHSSVLGKAGEEEVDDLLIRHTFGVPRQLVTLAKATLDEVPNPSSRRTRIDDIVNAIDRYAATNLWEDYKSSVNPPWFEEQAQGLESITHNILDGQDLAHLERDHPGLPSFLYARGMLGRPVGKPGQTVLEFHRANGLEVRLPASCEYVVVHPVLSAHLCHKKSPAERREFYTSDFIVGHGLSCPRKVVKPTLRVKYEGDVFWTFEAGSRSISFEKLLGVGESPLLTERDSTRAAFFLLLILVLAMKRHRVEWVTYDQLHAECAEVHQIMGTQIRIHGRDIRDYASARLAKAAPPDEVKLLNGVLREFLLGVSVSSGEAATPTESKKEKIDLPKLRKYSLRQCTLAEEAQGPVSNWGVLPSSMIAVQLFQPRAPID